MTRRLSSPGYLYAARALGLDYHAEGMAVGIPKLDGPASKLADLPASDGSPRDDARCLLIAAEALVRAADDRMRDEIGDGHLSAALDFETAHEILDNEDS